ncbi:MAG: alpha/beta hydrolase [Bacteroidota bacterium]
MKNSYKILKYILVCTLFVACKPYSNLPVVDSMNDLQYPFPVKKTLLSNDIEIAYIDEGQGSETILFVHGLGSYAPAWKKNIEELKSSYRCIAIDLPGYGKSSKGNYEGSMTFYAEIIKELIGKLGLEKVNLAGHSMGGQISIVTSLFYPEVVDKLILIAPAGFETFNEGEKDWFRGIFTSAAVQLTPPEQIELNYAYNFYDMPEDARFMIEDRIAMRSAKDFNGYTFIIPENVKGMVNEPVFDKLPNLQQETLIFFGQYDNLIPNRFLNGGKTEKIAIAGHQQIPNSKLVMVPKAGHFVMFEQSELVNQRIREFL